MGMVVFPVYVNAVVGARVASLVALIRSIGGGDGDGGLAVASSSNSLHQTDQHKVLARWHEHVLMLPWSFDTRSLFILFFRHKLVNSGWFRQASCPLNTMMMMVNDYPVERLDRYSKKKGLSTTTNTTADSNNCETK